MTQTLQVPWQSVYEMQTQSSGSGHNSLDKIKCSSQPGGHLGGGGTGEVGEVGLSSSGSSQSRSEYGRGLSGSGGRLEAKADREGWHWGPAPIGDRVNKTRALERGTRSVF